MVNNILGSQANLSTLLAQSVNNTRQTSSVIQGDVPNITNEQLNQLNNAKADQVLKQQLTSLFTISSTPSLNSYKLSNEDLALRTVISSQQEGLLKNESSAKLIERLNSSVKNIQGAYTNTSDILSSLGRLGHEQKTFLASSQQRVERSLNPYMESVTRANFEDDDNYQFELSVKTKEGDVINITFNSSQGYDEETGEAIDGFGISYEVEGDLSEAEHKALKQILTGVGEMADEFFKVSENSYSRYVLPNQSDINLDFLSDFDNQQLSGFNVYFSTTDGETVDPSENTFNLSYDIDEETQQQALMLYSQSGQSEIDFTLDMSTIGAKDTNQMKQYLASLDQSLEDTRVNSNDKKLKSAFGHEGDEVMQQSFELFKGAFTSMSSAAERYSSLESLAAREFNDGRAMVADLVANMVANDSRYQGLGNKAPNTMGAGISKLADFDAKFNFSMDRGDYQPENTVELSQTTEQEEYGQLSGITQNKTGNSYFHYQDKHPDYYDKKESYDINTAIKNNELIGLDQSHEVKVDKQTYQFNPDISRYELKMAMTEQTVSESNIRLINDIWLEKNEDSYDMHKKERVEGGVEQDDFKKTNSHSHNKLVTLIGDLDKLADDKKEKQEYLTDLGEVSFFMGKYI
jgi:hypothetical protein